MEDWDDFEVPFGIEPIRIDAPVRAVSVVSICPICGNESAYYKDRMICKECASRLKALIYPKAAGIDEII